MSGLVYAFLAYSLWGLFPLYFHQLSHVTAEEILVHRIIWSLLTMLILILVLRRGRRLWQAVQQRKVWAWLSVSAVLIAVNWLVYIWAVVNQHVVESSLGYFIMPIVSVLMGRLILKEAMHSLHWVAVVIAVVAVLWELVQLGSLPWVAVVVSISFASYGLVRKMYPVDSMTGLTIETFVLLPIALTWLVWQSVSGYSFQWGVDDMTTGLLIGSGIVTALPLLLFAMATMRARLSSVGFMQYINPTLQLSIGVYWLGEVLPSSRFITFIFVWTALVVYALGSWQQNKQA